MTYIISCAIAIKAETEKEAEKKFASMINSSDVEYAQLDTIDEIGGDEYEDVQCERV